MTPIETPQDKSVFVKSKLKEELLEELNQ